MDFFGNSANCQIIEGTENAANYSCDYRPKILLGNKDKFNLKFLHRHGEGASNNNNTNIASRNRYRLQPGHQLLFIRKSRYPYKKGKQH